MLTKFKPIRSIPYRNFVRSLPCVVCGRMSEAHHEQKEGHGTMGGKCCDSRLIPLCHACHAGRHNKGREFWVCRQLDPEIEITKVQVKWEVLGNKPFWEDQCE